MRLCVKPYEMLNIHDATLSELEFDCIVQTNHAIFIEKVEAHDAACYPFFDLTTRTFINFICSFLKITFWIQLVDAYKE